MVLHPMSKVDLGCHYLQREALVRMGWWSREQVGGDSSMNRQKEVRIEYKPWPLTPRHALLFHYTLLEDTKWQMNMLRVLRCRPQRIKLQGWEPLQGATLAGSVGSIHRKPTPGIAISPAWNTSFVFNLGEIVRARGPESLQWDHVS